jgi:Arc/MetJ-type ribon-helix-helix transcriptional regulator
MKSIDMKIKTKALQIRLSDKDSKMVSILRQKYYVNVSQFVRESLRKLYEGKGK